VDLIKRTTTEWRTGGGKTVTLKNLFDKPDSIERLNVGGQRISLETNTYDGLGRTVAQRDALGHFRQFSYDAFDRLLSQRLPDNALVERTYVTHSKEDLPTSIKVDGVGLGEQSFDGLDRMISSTTGGRLSVFDFVGGQLEPGKVHTPSGQVIDYVYQPQLGQQPTQRKTLSSTADYTYDRQNAQLLASKEQDQELERDYYSNGELKEERRVQGGQNYVMQYQYSHLGRLLSYTDVMGVSQTYDYDAAGRLEHTEVGSLMSSFTYNPLGQLASTETTDTANNRSLKISLEYDDAGREVLRAFSLPGGIVQTLAQAYDAADHLQQRTLKQGATVLRDEHFEYDSRGRLEVYTATGPQAPVDPQGKQIASQRFTFDALDNILEVETTFAGGSNTAVYEFAGADPTQLTAVRNSHGDYPAEILLSYDDDGNLITDEAGRLLDYDALGRLVSVSLEDDADGASYGYDAQDSPTSASTTTTREQRFYRDGELASQLNGQNQRSFIRAADALLAERHSGEGDALHLLATDAKKTVLVEIDSTSANDLEYTAYGHQSSATPAATRSAFNGELRESTTGWYLLGQGYRAYNPILMRFHSPDSLSPFEAGGLNAYMYCLGDPVNYRDPDGHLPAWAMMLIGVVGGVALGVITAGAATPAATALISAGVISASTASSIGAVAGGVSASMGVAALGTGLVGSFAGLDENTESLLGKVSLGLGLASGVAGGVSGGFLKASRAAAKAALGGGNADNLFPNNVRASDDAMSVTSESTFRTALPETRFQVAPERALSGTDLPRVQAVNSQAGSRSWDIFLRNKAARDHARAAVANRATRSQTRANSGQTPAIARVREIPKKQKIVRKEGWGPEE
jgi:RHS repeat-associated protein